VSGQHIQVRITRVYRDKLQLLALKHRRSMAQELMALIDEAEMRQGPHAAPLTKH
jgi:hypothetical protein